VTTASTRSFTLTLCNESPATQSLGSINLTAPTGFAITSASLPVCPSPVDGSPPCATIASNVLQARNLSIAAGTSMQIVFQATTASTAGTYTWPIAAKQSNDFNGNNNDFTLDPANSNLTTIVSTPPLPTTDLAVTQTQSPANPVTAGSTVVYTATVINNGPAASGSATFTNTLSGSGGNIVSIAKTSGPGAWVCPSVPAGATSASCTLSGGMANGETDKFQVQTNPLPSGSYNDTASISTVSPDSNTTNDSAPLTTTVSLSSDSGSGVVTYGKGGSASTGAIDPTTGKQFTATVFFPPAPCLATSTCPTGTTSTTQFTFTLTKLFNQILPCGGVLCNFAFDLNGTTGIPSGWNVANQPVRLVIQCQSPGQCGVLSHGSTGVEMIKNGNLPPLPQCSPAGMGNASPPFACLDSDNFNTSTQVYTMTILILSGDPRYYGICIDGGC
jgi:hypothetical protein